MKRLLKFLLNLLLALVAVALTFILIFFLTPAWQKRAVEEALARDTERTWQFDSVDIKPMRLQLEEVYMLDGDAGIGVQYVQLDGPLWKLPLLGEFEVESGSLIGLSIDVSKVDVGNTASRAYQDMLKRVSGDLDFWKERVALVLGKVSAAGVRVQLKNVQVEGHVIMPDNIVIPVRWVILEADSLAPRSIELAPFTEENTL